MYPKFKFKLSRDLGKQLLHVEGVSKAFLSPDGQGQKRLFKDVHINLRPGERLAIVGNNGVGKTTLLRLLAGNLEPDAGTIKWGATVQVGYLPQDHKEAVPENTTPFDWLRDAAPQESYEFIRGFLGRMLFSGPEQQKPTQALSGGEKARLLFAKLMMTESNVLLLDEPTNHLDLESIIALNDALKVFEGSLIFVSHDIEFINTLATQVLEITPNGHTLSGAGQFVI